MVSTYLYALLPTIHLLLAEDEAADAPDDGGTDEAVDAPFPVVLESSSSSSSFLDLDAAVALFANMALDFSAPSLLTFLDVFLSLSLDFTESRRL